MACWTCVPTRETVITKEAAYGVERKIPLRVIGAKREKLPVLAVSA
jgi:hypothetical protein